MFLMAASPAGLVIFPSSVAAQEAASPLTQRADNIVALFGGKANIGQAFAPSLLAQLPAEKLAAITEQLKSELGDPVRVDSVVAKGDNSATVRIIFTKAIATFDFAIEPSAPRRIAMLLFKGSETVGDDMTKIVADLRALPGHTALSVARLDEAGPTWLIREHGDQATAIGSTFKLYILAELSRQISAGTRHWDDIARLDRRSLPSGMLQDWPKGAPLTLHTLASLMISISDNSATDTLLATLGRDRVEAMMGEAGNAHAAANRPLLSTYDMFALKGTSDESLAESYIAGDEAARRALLPQIAGVDRTSILADRFSGNPRWIDSIEWFASPEDLVRVMDWLRRNGDQTTRDILAINDGVADQDAQKFAYVGYKGGSESGVLNTTYLLRDKAGRWYSVSASWNDPAAPLADGKLFLIASRAIRLVAASD
jgi:hypothetical protein